MLRPTVLYERESDVLWGLQKQAAENKPSGEDAGWASLYSTWSEEIIKRRLAPWKKFYYLQIFLASNHEIEEDAAQGIGAVLTLNHSTLGQPGYEIVRPQEDQVGEWVERVSGLDVLLAGSRLPVPRLSEVVDLDEAFAAIRLPYSPPENGLPVVKVSPEERITPIENAAIPTIPMSAIQPFLSEPRVVEKDGLDHAPFILGTNRERMILGEGDEVYATGGPAGVKRWNILRMGPPLKDPVTGEVLGYEAKYLGDARTIKDGAPQKLLITRSVEEIESGDKLEPAKNVSVFEYVPSAPAKPVDGRIIAAYGGFAEPSRYQTVVIDLGRRNGLVPGNVLAIYRTGAAVKLTSAQRKDLTWVGGSEGGAPSKGGAWLDSDIRCLTSTSHVSWSSTPSQDAFRKTCLTTSSPDDSVKLPDARSGLLMVYEVFDKVSYGLILEADGPVYLLDTVKNP